MKVKGMTVTCQHGTIVVFPSGDLAKDADCNCLPSEFERAYNRAGQANGNGKVKTIEQIHVETTFAEVLKNLPRDPKGQASMLPEELKQQCIEAFNTEKKSVSECNYDECTTRAHEYEMLMLLLQEKVKAVRSRQVDIISDEKDEKKRNEYLHYKPCPPSVKEAVTLSPEQKKQNKLEKEIDNAMQSLSLDRDLAMMFLRKTKPNLFN